MPQLRLLHRGGISSVFCAETANEEHKIVKAYHKGCDLQPRHWLNITREVAILNTLRDLKVPGVVQLCGTLDDAANLCLVFEPCRGGDLYKRLAQCGLLTEAQLCRQVIVPLLKVLSQLHSLGITHRDIKPENIFFDGCGSLVLGDFGLAIRAPECATSRVGTLDYMAPEVLAQPSPDVVVLRQLKPRQLPSYDNKVDVWALGVLIYEALMGVTPFGHPDPEMASLQAQFRRPARLRPGVSSGCADFVARVLTKQAGLRPTAALLLGHPWVQQHLEGGDVMVYGAAAQQWARAAQGGILHPSLAANIERVTSCPESTPAAGTTPAAAACGNTSAQPGASGMQTSASKVDGDRFANMSRFLQQSLVQQQPPELSIQARPRPWEKLVQQHRQQQQLAALPAPAPGSVAIAALNPFGAAAHACAGRTASAQWSVSAFASPASAGCSTAQPLQALLPQSPLCTATSAQYAAGMSAAAGPPAVQLAGASSLPSALQQTMLCSSTPASPVTDKSGPAFWLLSPQQPAAKHMASSSWGQHHSYTAQQQPAILAGLPVYAAGKLRRPAAAAAAAGPAAGAGAANAQGLLQSHILNSPMQAQIAAWPVGVGAVPLSPVAISPSPAANTNSLSFFQLLSPCKAAPAAAGLAAASPARPQLLAPTPAPCLVRHASAGLLLQPNPFCASLPPAPLPYRPGLAVQRELLQGMAGSAAATGERGLHASASARQLQPLQVVARSMPHAGSSIGSSSGCGGGGSSSNCSSLSSSPDVPGCSPASPELDVLLAGSPDCCAGLGSLPASSYAAKHVLPGPSAACTDTAEADQQQLALGDVPPAVSGVVSAGVNSAGACCDTSKLSPLGQLLVDTHGSVGLAAAATAAAALPMHTAAAAAEGAKETAVSGEGVSASSTHVFSSRSCSPAAAYTALPFLERQAALEEELVRAQKTRARSLWKKVQGVCKMVSKPRPSAA